MPGRDRRRDDRGFATVWAGSAVVALLSVGALVWWFGAATAVRHRATAAADLAALAASAHAERGIGGACVHAREVATEMGVRLEDCRLVGWDVLVRVAADLPEPFAAAASARARAGPVDRRDHQIGDLRDERTGR
ncbi:helicase/secretion neighborhood TadE-like protein [Amycolatopsis arida]|uniref:Helicase/secretion neighborhood TadE-like protein n=1 Tax=Amycolatopsis arida TaxID=587909 RepID=A0A1I6AYE6_9PSEU|nr:Rv3654c family TadE-like protein [Amycolatopsis arida]TDX83895.1 secretion/DNA translocation related TadE-like protein [Amycolatopsis arida]SFQ73692.1 helicase/secretion neighborhood TadE-like protein [Amycolatopsis arida]